MALNSVEDMLSEELRDVPYVHAARCFYCVRVRCTCDEGWPSPGQRCKGSQEGSAKDLKLDSPVEEENGQALMLM